ncbi:MAG: LPP20 family lipoprotein [Flavobacteriales bacterium]|nr:LPP20 family lipoprotein [Flavobacteriales bacterium]
MTRLIHIVLLLTILAGCKNLGKTTETVDTNPAPSWISDRPILSGYYVGIGSANKFAAPEDFGRVAKDNALNDLASEISVEIQGESFLNTLEVNNYFQEEFISNISTSTKEVLQDYEIVDSWEDGTQYWVYYRLSAARHAENKRIRKEQALSGALEGYKRAKISETEGHVKDALSEYMDALVTLHPYWNEINLAQLQGKEVHLDHEIYSSFKSLIRDVQIEPSVTKVVLNEVNHYKTSITLLAHVRGNPAVGYPIKYRVFQPGTFGRYYSVQTNGEGKAEIRIEGLNPRESKGLQLEVISGIDPLELTGENPGARRPLMDQVKFSELKLPVDIVWPSMSISSNEMNLGQLMAQPILANALQNALSDQGMRFTQGGSAEYRVFIQSATTSAGTSQGFHVAHLELTVQIEHVKSHEIVYTWQKSGIKGLQLSFEAAGTEAYKKGAKELSSTITEEIIDAIF